MSGSGDAGGSSDMGLSSCGSVAAFSRTDGTRSAEDALALVSKGESPVPEGIDTQELAAWTMLASAVLSSDSTIVKN